MTAVFWVAGVCGALEVLSIVANIVHALRGVQ